MKRKHTSRATARANAQIERDISTNFNNIINAIPKAFEDEVLNRLMALNVERRG